MDHAAQSLIARTLAEAALHGKSESDLLELYCAQLVSKGIPLARAMFGLDTLHPVLWGRVYEWRRGQAEVRKS